MMLKKSLLSYNSCTTNARLGCFLMALHFFLQRVSPILTYMKRNLKIIILLQLMLAEDAECKLYVNNKKQLICECSTAEGNFYAFIQYISKYLHPSHFLVQTYSATRGGRFSTKAISKNKLSPTPI